MTNQHKSKRHPTSARRGGTARTVIAHGLRCSVAGLAVALAPLAARADVIDPATYQSWLDMVTESQAAQPRWMTPLVTVTPRLEQELRWDFYDQQNGTGSQGNGQHILNYGGPGGTRVEFIPFYNVEVIVGAPPLEIADGPKGFAQGAGDWPTFLAKYRLISANEQNGNYIVTAFLQETEALGTSGKISTNVDTLQPTLAFGKGWGDFDIQMTVSEQYGVAALEAGGDSASTNLKNFGDPVLWNTTFQYHFMQYFWPELEVNYEYWPNGEHVGLSQVLLTPGIIFGRFALAPRQNLIFGVGYQFAVSSNPVTQNNLVVSARLTF